MSMAFEAILCLMVVAAQGYRSPSECAAGGCAPHPTGTGGDGGAGAGAGRQPTEQNSDRRGDGAADDG